jgi:hypothetical protein
MTEAELPFETLRTMPNIIRRGADKSLAFSISYFPICNTTTRFFFLDVLKKLEQRIRKCVELKGGICSLYKVLNEPFS